METHVDRCLEGGVRGAEESSSLSRGPKTRGIVLGTRGRELRVSESWCWTEPLPHQVKITWEFFGSRSPEVPCESGSGRPREQTGTPDFARNDRTKGKDHLQDVGRGHHRQKKGSEGMGPGPVYRPQEGRRRSSSRRGGGTGRTNGTRGRSSMEGKVLLRRRVKKSKS